MEDGYKWIALSNTTLAILLATLDASITLIAMPDIFRGIHLDPLVPGNSSYGQAGLRGEQREAIGEIDLLLLPVGGGPTIGAEVAAEIARELEPRWVVPMHYRTERIGFLETAEEFLVAMEETVRLRDTAFETSDLPRDDGPAAVVPAAP